MDDALNFSNMPKTTIRVLSISIYDWMTAFGTETVTA